MPEVCVTVTTEQAQRILATFTDLEDENGNPRPATQADVLRWLKSIVKDKVRSFEAHQAMLAKGQEIDDEPW